MADTTGTVTVGLLWKGQARKLCARMKFERECEDYFEDSSLFESTFLLRGLTPAGITRLRHFMSWLQEVGAT